MESALAQLLNRVDEVIGGLIDVADMPESERVELNEFISRVTEAIFSRF